MWSASDLWGEMKRAQFSQNAVRELDFVESF